MRVYTVLMLEKSITEQSFNIRNTFSNFPYLPIHFCAYIFVLAFKMFKQISSKSQSYVQAAYIVIY